MLESCFEISLAISGLSMDNIKAMVPNTNTVYRLYIIEIIYPGSYYR